MKTIMELNLNTSKILKNQLINNLGLSKYLYLVDNLQNTNLTLPSDGAEKYRTTFNSFYRVRRNETWRKAYYEFFQEIKSDEKIEFRDVLDGLKKKGIKSIEPSFASKMLAMINPDKPIWDSRVLVALELDEEWKNKRNEEHAIEIYNCICERYKEFEVTEKCKECIREFNSWFPEYKRISKTKKIDFLLWSYGTDIFSLKSMGDCKGDFIKVYFDQQIWALLENGFLNVEIINRAAEMSRCKYYLSVAHLEELHNAEKKETENRKGITRRLEIFMKKHTVPGVIKETFEWIEFHTGEKEYQVARNTIWKTDTMDIIQGVSDIGLSAQKQNGIDPKNLFEGRKHDLDTEYKDVWDIQLVKELLRRYDIENAKYQDLKNNYLKLNCTMALVFCALTAAGYKRDKNEKLHNSGAYDVQHAIRATYCDVFVTNDNNLKSKYKAVAYYMGIPIEILSFKEFESKYGL